MEPSSTIRRLDSDSLSEVLRGRMGLVLGHGATHSNDFYSRLNEDLAAKFSISPADNFLETAGQILQGGIEEEAAIRNAIRDFTSVERLRPETRELARIKWAAVLSACFDGGFDDAFQQRVTQSATRHPVAVLHDAFTPVPPKSTPVFKLLGSVSRDDFCCTTPAYKRRSSTWHMRLRPFAELVQGAPIVCIGLGEIPWLLADLFAAMTATPITTPSSVVFLAEDIATADQLLVDYLGHRPTIFTASAGLHELISRSFQAQDTSLQLPLPSGERVTKLASAAAQYEDLVTVVNAHLETNVGQDQKHLLADILFSPGLPRWDPFAHNLDLRRSFGKDLFTRSLELARAAASGSAAEVIRGSAASGKTTVLKRLAYDLARAGVDVLWFKPAYYQDSQRALMSLFGRIREHLAKTRPVVFVDDPTVFTNFSPRDIVTAAEASRIEVVLVSAARTSEWSVLEESTFTGGLPTEFAFTIPDDLDDSELNRLPAYLVDLGVYHSAADATAAVTRLTVRNAKDTLSMIYWLLPATQASIQQSLRDEYFRLGDRAAFTKLLLGHEAHTSDLLRQAYRLVAVATHMRSPLAIEVLVSALGVPFGDWLDVARVDNGWGLLYPTGDPQVESVMYATRNDVVTDVIMEIVNGGRLGHTGEFAALQVLLSACTGSQAPYRDFCLKVLVPSSKLDRFSFAEGLDLFDRALAALPYPDRTIRHHRAIWMRNHGNDPDAARVALTEALTTPEYPYTAKGERDELIFTSLAANELDALELHRVAPDEAKTRVLTYLHKARSIGFLDPHTVHIEASLMRTLIAKLPGTSETDRNILLNEAIGNVERTLMLLQHRAGARGVDQDAHLLSGVRDSLLELIPSADWLLSEAERLWTEIRSQAGFVLAARYKYGLATKTDRGTDYFDANSYAVGAMERVAGEGGVPSPELNEIWVQIHYHWRVLRRAVVGVGGATDWQRLYEVTSMLTTLRNSPGRYFFLYVKALALTHLGRWPEATAVFAELRRFGIPRHVLHARRDVLLNSDGRPAVVQGHITEAGHDRFFHVPEWHTDIPTDAFGQWPRRGEIAFSTIEFAFAGPTAVLESRTQRRPRP